MTLKDFNNLSLEDISTDKRATGKKYRKGNTFRKTKKVGGEGTFWFSDVSKMNQKYQRKKTSHEKILPQNRNREIISHGVQYSLGKKKRWQLIAALRDRDEYVVHVESHPKRQSAPVDEHKIKSLDISNCQCWYHRHIKMYGKFVLQTSLTFTRKARKGNFVYQRRWAGKKGVSLASQLDNQQCRAVDRATTHVFVWTPDLQNQLDSYQVEKRRRRRLKKNQSGAERTAIRTGMVHQHRDGFDERPKQAIRVRRAMSPKQKQKFGL